MLALLDSCELGGCLTRMHLPRRDFLLNTLRQDIKKCVVLGAYYMQ